MARESVNSTILVDDDKVRVTRFDFNPGAETGWHVHEMDYVITALTECHMQLDDIDGSTKNVVVAKGEAYRKNCGVEHNVINAGEHSMSFIEVELK